MKTACYRQGDVFLVPVRSLPSEGRQARGNVLAEGEVTGHSHRFRHPNSVQVFTSGQQLYVEVFEETADLIHQEHGPIAVPRGGYEVRIQREYTPKGIQRVVD
jgi:hypothetical protein